MSILHYDSPQQIPHLAMRDRTIHEFHEYKTSRFSIHLLEMRDPLCSFFVFFPVFKYSSLFQLCLVSYLLR